MQQVSMNGVRVIQDKNTVTIDGLSKSKTVYINGHKVIKNHVTVGPRNITIFTFAFIVGLTIGVLLVNG
jgi:hypothetical protein